jgi:hypothetical protein
MSAPQQLDGDPIGVEPVVPSIVATFEEAGAGSLSPMTQELVGAGDETIGLTPALLSSVAPSGIEPTDESPEALPAVGPVTLEVDAVVVLVALPPELQGDVTDAVFVLIPPPSKEVSDGMAPPPELPIPEQPAALAVGSSGAGLKPPGESSIDPRGIPTPPTADVVPGTPSGDVAPIARLAVVSGAVWAKLGLMLNSSTSDPMARLFKATSHCQVVSKVNGRVSAVCRILRRLPLTCALVGMTNRCIALSYVFRCGPLPLS